MKSYVLHRLNHGREISTYSENRFRDFVDKRHKYRLGLEADRRRSFIRRMLNEGAQVMPVVQVPTKYRYML